MIEKFENAGYVENFTRELHKGFGSFVQVLNEVSQLITGGNMQMQMIGCSILSALMAEYATTVKSSDVGLAWEIHFKAKKQFELTDLKSIFQFCVQALKGELNLFYDLYILLCVSLLLHLTCKLQLKRRVFAYGIGPKQIDYFEMGPSI